MGEMVLEAKGGFPKTESWLAKIGKMSVSAQLSRYGEKGVRALASSTPRRTGKTAGSWGYEISQKGNKWTITWTNTNIVNGVPIALVLEYGHGTGTGGYVAGRQYITKAIEPIMNEIADGVWKAVKNG
jgi:hypothetical protein